MLEASPVDCRSTPPKAPPSANGVYILGSSVLWMPHRGNTPVKSCSENQMQLGLRVYH